MRSLVFFILFSSLITISADDILKLRPSIQTHFWQYYKEWLISNFKAYQSPDKALINKYYFKKITDLNYLVEFTEFSWQFFKINKNDKNKNNLVLCPISLAISDKSLKSCSNKSKIVAQKFKCPAKIYINNYAFPPSQNAICYQTSEKLMLQDDFPPHILNQLKKEVITPHIKEFNLSPGMIGIEHDTNVISIYYL